MKTRRPLHDDSGTCVPEEQTSSTEDIMEKNLNLAQLARVRPAEFGLHLLYLLRVGCPPHPGVRVDEDRLIGLLGWSRCLSLGEKRRILLAIGQLTQMQIHELVRVLDEERRRWAALSRRAPC
jgi:hypothetical protein